MAENPIIEAYLEGDVKYLTKHKFENVWQSVLKKYVKRWEKTKKNILLALVCKEYVSIFIHKGVLLLVRTLLQYIKAMNRYVLINQLNVK